MKTRTKEMIGAHRHHGGGFSAHKPARNPNGSGELKRALDNGVSDFWASRGGCPVRDVADAVLSYRKAGA